MPVYIFALGIARYKLLEKRPTVVAELLAHLLLRNGENVGLIISGLDPTSSVEGDLVCSADLATRI